MTTSRTEQPTREIDWQALINTALETPGSVGNTYSRFHNYSFMNCLYLALQGAEGPVASYKRWQALGRQVVKGARGFEIVRPITIKREDEDGEQRTFTRFKVVRGAFSYNQTTGDPLPPAPELPEWSLERAERQLDIRRVPYAAIDGNMQGYSVGREYAVNPVARFPFKTTVHELGHIVLGHTSAADMSERPHQGVREWQAETTAYLTTHELGAIDDEAASVSRGYVQGWMAGERPTDMAIRQVFGATDKILKTGRMAIEGGDDA
jgi:hypothetical protein